MKRKCRKDRLLMLALFFVWTALQLRIWNLMTELADYEDFLSLSYPAGGITAPAFGKWEKSEESKAAKTAAVWKPLGDLAVLAESTGRQETLACYQMKGQPEAVFGKGLSSGRYFTEGEQDVCLLDVETVQKLFGSEDVLGLAVKVEGRRFHIAGILDENGPVCVIPAEEGAVFDGITIRRKESDQSVKMAVSCTEAVLGGTNGQVVDGKLYRVTAGTLYAGTSAGMVLAVGTAGRERRKKKEGGSSFLERRIVPACLLAGTLMLLAGIWAVNPGSDYLPPYWSDFEFFEKLLEEKTGQIRQFLAHQEFASWQRLARSWREAMALEIGNLAVAAAYCLGCRRRFSGTRKRSKREVTVAERKGKAYTLSIRSAEKRTKKNTRRIR